VYYPAFGNQWLISIKIDKELAHISWERLRLQNTKLLRNCITQIALVKRCEDGQFYVAQGFREMVHFTIGNKGRIEVTNFFQRVGIDCHVLRGFSNDRTSPSWFHVQSMPGNSAATVLQKELHTKIRAVGLAFLPHLMRVSTFSVTVQLVVYVRSKVFSFSYLQHSVRG